MSKHNIQEVDLKGGYHDKKETIIISNLPDNAKELAMELSGLLSSLVGHVKYMEFPTDHYSNLSQENLAECRFFDEVDVYSALAKIHGLLFHNYHLIAQLKEDYLSHKHHTSDRAVMVRSLPPHFSSEDAWRLFENCGKLGFLKIFRDTSYHALECIVNFFDKQAVTKALKMNNAEYLDGPIKVLKINFDYIVAAPVPSSLLLDLSLILEEIRKMECFIHACVSNYGYSNQEHIFLYCLNEKVFKDLLSCREFKIFGETFAVFRVRGKCKTLKQRCGTSEQIAVTSMQRPETFGQSSEESGQFPETSKLRSDALELRSDTSEMEPGTSGLRSEISGQSAEADSSVLSSMTSRLSSGLNPPCLKPEPSNQKLTPPETRNRKPCVYVLGVPSDTSESDLVAQFGEATVELSFRTNITRLVFKTKEEAEHACKRSIRIVKGVRVTVCDTLQQASAILSAWKDLSPTQLTSERYSAKRKKNGRGHGFNLTQTQRNEQDVGHQLNLTQTQRNEQDSGCQLNFTVTQEDVEVTKEDVGHQPNLTQTQRNEQGSGCHLSLKQPGSQLNLTQPNETVTYGGYTAYKIINDFYYLYCKNKRKRKK